MMGSRAEIGSDCVAIKMLITSDLNLFDSFLIASVNCIFEKP
jgi:hypothetical protein